MEKTIVVFSAFLLYAVHISSADGGSKIQPVRENGEIKLTCQDPINDQLKTTETWYKNGRRLNFSQEIAFKVVAKNGTLTFPDQVEYEAVYQCFGNSSANKNTSVRGKYC